MSYIIKYKTFVELNCMKLVVMMLSHIIGIYSQCSILFDVLPPLTTSTGEKCKPQASRIYLFFDDWKRYMCKRPTVF